MNTKVSKQMHVITSMAMCVYVHVCMHTHAKKCIKKILKPILPHLKYAGQQIDICHALNDILDPSVML